MQFLMAQGVPVMICYCVREGCCHGQAARVYTRPAGHFVVLLKRLFFWSNGNSVVGFEEDVALTRH